MSGRFAGHATHRPHGSGVRGLYDGDSGRFGHLFPKGQPFALSALARLAEAMRAQPDRPKDGPDEEEGRIPAAYTYLGQFVDHDITFDPSTFQQQKQEARNFRTPRLDLDSVYGRGPADQPYMYDGLKFLLGERLIPVDRNREPRDLPRAASNSVGVRRAIIGDPRNDENVIVSQLHGLFLRFHNAVVDVLPDACFEEVQQKVRWHYQWMVLHDLLPRLVDAATLEDVWEHITRFDSTKPPRLCLFPGGAMSFMPVEFSVAAYRLGHSMVRPGYRLNERTRPVPIFDPDNPTMGLNAFGEFPRGFAIDWQRFVDLGLPQPDQPEDRVQLAYSLDTSLVEPLSRLPKSIAGDEAETETKRRSLAYRNLERSNLLALPTGQEVVKYINDAVGGSNPITPLGDDEILIGPVEKSLGDGVQTIGQVHSAFKGRAPLWTYVLAEARNHWRARENAVLTGVGGRIVAEVFVSLLVRDRSSYLGEPGWRPDLGTGGTFTLPDLIRTALKIRPAG
jgi:hypothetical protein